MKQTFVVEIIYQQHASWQGRVRWVNTGKKEYFRSALELIHLIDSTLIDEKKDNDVEKKAD